MLVANEPGMLSPSQVLPDIFDTATGAAIGKLSTGDHSLVVLEDRTAPGWPELSPRRRCRDRRFTQDR